ncbi:MAG: isoprenylcysteine carboxylmethyltransferase family protein [Steroidobacteraceae bacterium]
MAALSYNERMTTSGSTPRIRLTQLLYLLVLALVAVSGGGRMQGACSLLAQCSGFVLVVSAVLWRIWATFFIAGRKEEQLVRDGPFSLCRHPLYLGSIVGAAGIGLTTLSLTLTFALPLAISAIVSMAALREDAALLAAHGDAWRGYRDSVPAFWPGGPGRRMPESVAVPPRIYRKAFFDAASFLGLWLLVLLIESLRAAGTWPPLFRLP